MDSGRVRSLAPPIQSAIVAGRTAGFREEAPHCLALAPATAVGRAEPVRYGRGLLCFVCFDLLFRLATVKS